MKLWRKVILVACILAIMIPTFGCSEEGPMEKAGKKMDQAVDDASDAADNIADDAKKALD
ncbi:MAG: transport-associated protein [Pseudodesulfovibrio sp.]|nr:transport-associated protein [Pseudodesulfovibrio sp.]